MTAFVAPLVVDRIRAVRVPVAVVEIVLGVLSVPTSWDGPRSTSRSRCWPSSASPSCCSSPASSSTCTSCAASSCARPALGYPVRARRRRRGRGRARPVRPRRQRAPRRHPAVGHVAGTGDTGAARGRPARHPPRAADDGVRVDVGVRRRRPAVAAVHQGDGEHVRARRAGRRLLRAHRRDRPGWRSRGSATSASCAGCSSGSTAARRRSGCAGRS